MGDNNDPNKYLPQPVIPVTISFMQNKIVAVPVDDTKLQTGVVLTEDLPENPSGEPRSTTHEIKTISLIAYISGVQLKIPQNQDNTTDDADLHTLDIRVRDGTGEIHLSLTKTKKPADYFHSNQYYSFLLRPFGYFTKDTGTKRVSYSVIGYHKVSNMNELQYHVLAAANTCLKFLNSDAIKAVVDTVRFIKYSRGKIPTNPEEPSVGVITQDYIRVILPSVRENLLQLGLLEESKDGIGYSVDKLSYAHLKEKNLLNLYEEISSKFNI
ncbi:hypothetical protein DLAC_07722 [Tieghemostelium lacteum]|uniref:Uncharacterized protein n=1 Tax=Tieghemostelium lacteum TaxID=361077 RepID=A0A151ZA75_TIELA|nr:hypothetical protein DLAC_07722 [Tieghemostelium lacteum]|eukprot:KYQ90851.1 hypothetical protein DLAC_07722 [Tieghemostelium lacteum]